MTDPLPSRRTVEHWLSECNGWLVLLVDEHGQSPPYRWAWSGLDGVRSQGWGPRSGGPSITILCDDGSLETVSCSAVEVAALNDAIARVTRAGAAIRTAMQQLELAHRLLTPTVYANGNAARGRGWIPRAQHADLVDKQRARTALGNGYGDA